MVRSSMSFVINRAVLIIGLSGIGFDLSTMAAGMFDDAIVDAVGPEAIVSNAYVIKVHILHLTFVEAFFSTLIYIPLGS